MRRWVLLALFATGCSGYDNNDVELAVTYAAKETCSCLWVMERDEAYCRAWTIASPAVAEVEIDHDEKQVTSHALMLWETTARFVSREVGCALVSARPFTEDG